MTKTKNLKGACWRLLRNKSDLSSSGYFPFHRYILQIIYFYYVNRVSVGNKHFYMILYCFTLLSPANIYLFKINNRNTRDRCEICSKLTIKILERRQWRRTGIFNFEHISHLFLVFQLLTLNKINVSWVVVLQFCGLR